MSRKSFDPKSVGKKIVADSLSDVKTVVKETVKRALDLKAIQFDKGEAPAGEMIPIRDMPMVMRFPPVSYQRVKPEQFDAWKKEIEERLGSSFDIGAGGGGTISFCERGGSGAAYRCDSDVESSSASRPAQGIEGAGKGLDANRTPWPVTPVVLDFPPIGYGKVLPEQFKDWQRELDARFGSTFDIGPGLQGTVSFCTTPGSGYGYRCDCDV
mgnify:CR=1 FL=1